MRAGIITGKKSFELREFPDPVPTPGRVVAQIDRCGICGSDTHAYTDGFAYSPGLCGHEWFGTITGVGSGVGNISEGDRVVGGIAPGCGTCEPCTAGRPQYCRVAFAAFMGSGPGASPSGGFASHIDVDPRKLTKMPDSLDMVQGALVEPATVAMHAVNRSKIQTGDVVAVLGAGPIGQLTAQCARVAGAGHIVIVEPDSARGQRAIDLGADAAVQPGEEAHQYCREVTNGQGVDVAYDAAGVAITLAAAADLCRRGGNVCMVGVASEDATIRPASWLVKELSVDMSMAYTHDEFDVVANLIADGRLRVRELHDETVTLDELEATIEALADRSLDAIKVLVDPTAG